VRDRDYYSEISELSSASKREREIGREIGSKSQDRVRRRELIKPPLSVRNSAQVLGGGEKVGSYFNAVL
jgi:hypothetical protein